MLILINAEQSLLNNYKEYRKSMKGSAERLPFRSANIIEKAKEKITGKSIESSFLEEVGKAMRRNDKHQIPAVQKAAQEYRKVLNEIANHAIDAGIWKGFPDRKTAESYFTRVLDQDTINENIEEFSQIVLDDVIEQTHKRVEYLNAKYDRQKSNIQSQIDNLDINKFRKASFLQEQAEIAGKEVGMTLDDVKASLEYLANGKPRKPESLLSFISKEGGIDKNDPLFSRPQP
jgi:hypothetical protein